MEKIILIGGGGHCKVVIDAILSMNKYRICGILDLKKRIGEKVSGIRIVGCDEDIEKIFESGVKNCFITAGSIGALDLRIKLFKKASKTGFKFPNIIHKNSLISKFALLKEGNYVAPQAVINSAANIGNNCIINTGAIIEHDCNIGDFAHIAPGVTISGGVTVGRCTHIGTGSSVIQGLKIGKNSFVGAGSVVVKDIADNLIYFGNPIRKMKKHV